jgi:hypothetical protein
VAGLGTVPVTISSGCNNMTAYSDPSNLVYGVQPPSEVYTGAVCANFAPVAPSKFIVPAGPKLGLKPLQPAGTAQAVLEYAISERLAALPKWLPSACQTSMRRLACTGAFMAAKSQLFPPSTFLDFPSFPCQSTCMALNADCGAFFSVLMASGQASQFVNCSASTLQPPLLDYPPAGVASAFLPPDLLAMLGGLGITSFGRTNCTAPGADVVCASGSCNTVCPTPLVVPDDSSRNDAEVAWIPPTACALPCPTPFYTDGECG